MSFQVSAPGRSPGRISRRLVRPLVGVLMALTLALLAGVPSRAVENGYDVSWPQCPNGQPMPPASTSFVVIGLTNGLAFTVNPCVSSQLAWARTHGVRTDAYAMATYPTQAQFDQYQAAGPWSTATREGQLRNVGYAEGRAALATLAANSFKPKMVWVDVEPRTKQPWPGATNSDLLANREIVTGLLRAIEDAGFGTGIYSYLSGWQQITGGWQVPQYPVWSPAGRLDFASEARDLCVKPSFSGGRVFLAQWTDGTYDYNITCENVYAAYVAGTGWQGAVADGTSAGSAGSGRQIEALRLAMAGGAVTGDISWRGWVQDRGWEPWTTSADHIGSGGARLEAFEIKLTGNLASTHSIRYSAYVQGLGWQTRLDGGTAGTIGQGLRIEAVTIELVPKQAPPPPPPPPGPPVTGAFRSVAPCRVLDTRVPIGVAVARKVPAGGTIDVDMTGPCGVPSTGVGAVALNVTVANGSAPGHLTVHPAGQATPWASNLNFAAGQTIANMVVVNAGIDGKVSLHNGSSAPVDVVADVAGWTDPSGTGSVNTITPQRILDTRGGENGFPLGTTRIAPVAKRGTLDVKVTGVGGVPATGVTAVVVNLTVTSPTAPGFLTAYPSNESLPVVSNLNFVAGQTIPNLAVVKVGPDGIVKIYNGSDGTAHVIADVSGWTTAADPTQPGVFMSLTPQRILDTRGVGGAELGAPVARVPAQGSISVKVTGVGGVPLTGVGAVVLNLTATNTAADGWVVAYPSGGSLPTASNVNFVAKQSIANLVTVKVGPDGRINLTNGSPQPLDLVADIAGYVSG